MGPDAGRMGAKLGGRTPTKTNNLFLQTQLKIRILI